MYREPSPAVEDETVTTTVETCPIHKINAWLVPTEGGSSCTSGGRYCFLHSNIAFEDESDDDRAHDAEGAEDLAAYNSPSKSSEFESNVTALKRYITIMVHQGMDIATVVENVYRMYDVRIKPSVPDFVHPITGARIVTPEWSRDAILDHLMESTDPVWSQLFTGACTIMLRKLIMKANANVIDKDTGKFISENAKALCEFIDRHDRHLLAVATAAARNGAKRRKVET